MKSVCFIISDISRCGGTERITLLISNQLSLLGWNVTILSLRGNGCPYFASNQNVKICTLNNSIEEHCFHKHPKYTILKLRMWCRVHYPDIIIDTSLMMGNTTIPAITGLGIKHITWDNFSYEYFKQVNHEQEALKKIKNNHSHLITLTALDRELFVSEQHVNPDLVHHIPNPVTFNNPYPIKHIKKRVISVGRFAPEKGFDLLLKAWEIVERNIDNWSLEIWGDTGKDTGDVKKNLESLPLKRAYLFPATSNISQIYNDAAIYVLPSRHEGFGLVLLEASSYSIPLIAFNCPNGPREIIKHGYNGLLVEPNDIEGLATAIIWLINHREEREKMGQNAFNFSKNFTMDKIIPRWIELLESI